MNGEQDGLWQFVYEDQSYVESVFDNGKKQSEQKFFKAQDPELKTGLKISKVYKSVYTEMKEDGEWKSKWPNQRYFVHHLNEYHNIKHRNAFDKIIKHKARLVNVAEDTDKRVETYDYTFQKGYGHSEATITIYKKPQKAPNGKKNYDILFHFPHNKGEYRYYFQHEHEGDKLARENQKKIREIQKELREILDEEEKKKNNKN